ncbi:unnamed protein product, partial [Sphacelaria rigidula]
MIDRDIPEHYFAHPHTSVVLDKIFFYAYGNTPPTDLLQHVPLNPADADILCLGCGDIRDVLYTVLLHGRRGAQGENERGRLSFVLNDIE